MLIYRIESRCGKGVYNIPKYNYILRDAYAQYNNGSADGGKHPTPTSDQLNMIYITQEWINEFYPSLIRYESPNTLPPVRVEEIRRAKKLQNKAYKEINRNILFGFETLKSLETWFPKQLRRKMQDICISESPTYLRVGVFAVNEKYIRKGNSQIVFFRKRARRVKTLDIVSLEPFKEISNVEGDKKVCSKAA